MPYFQNNFNQDFVGVLVIGDRQYSMNFKVKGNVNSSVEMIAWNPEPFNLSGNTNLTINFSLDSGATWASKAFNVTTGAVSLTAVTAQEVVTALNNDTGFAALFTAEVFRNNQLSSTGLTNYVKIRANKPRENWKCYIANSGAESIMRFNKKSGVAELPTYFARHTVTNIGSSTYPDCAGVLVQLSNPVSGVDVAIVTEAGGDPNTVQTDWQLFRGKSQLFTFKKQTVDSSSRLTQVIEYPAGALAGDFAKKTTYTYTSTKTVADTICEVPYTLQPGDLIIPG